MAMRGAVGQGQHHDAAGLGAEGGRGGGVEAGWRHPVARWSAEGQIDPGGVLEVEPFGEAVGGQRRGRWQRGGADRRFAGDSEFADRAGFLAVVQQDRNYGARRRRHIDEGIDPAAGRQHQRAIAGLERLGRLAVDGHDADLEPLQF